MGRKRKNKDIVDDDCSEGVSSGRGIYRTNAKKQHFIHGAEYKAKVRPHPLDVHSTVYVQTQSRGTRTNFLIHPNKYMNA